MKNIITGFASFLAAACLFAAAPAQTGAAETPTLPYAPLPAAALPDGAPRFTTRADMERFVDEFMQDAFDRYGLVGGVVAVVRDGAPFFAKGYGYRDLEQRQPVEPDKTMFRIGSVSKLFTWTAVMQLVEQGRLDLDADVNRYIQDFKLPDTFESPVTLRNLMTHSGGIDEWVVGGHFFSHDPRTRLALATALQRYMPARIRPPTTDFGADRSSSYSNWGTALAGHIVARASGVPFEDYVERFIFTPLGMANSTFREPPERDFGEGLIHPYAPDPDGTMRRRPFEHAGSFAPAGSGSTTAADIMKFAVAHLNDGAGILSPQTAGRMHARSLALNPHTNGHTLGFYEIYFNGRRAIEHTGGTMYFHSDLLLLPQEKFALFVSFNTSSGRTARVAFKQAFMDRYFPATLPPVTPLPDAGARDAAHTGLYRMAVSNGQSIDKLLAVGGEVAVSRLGPGELFIDGLDGTAERWVEVAPHIVRNERDGTLATFTLRPDGAAARLTGAETNNPLERLAWYETTRFHTVLLALCGMILLSFLPRLAWHRGPPAERLFVRLTGAAGLSVAAGLAIALYWVKTDLAAFVFQTPASFHLVRPLLWAGMALLLGAALLLAVLWLRRTASPRLRLHGLATAVALAAALWSAGYWNLV